MDSIDNQEPASSPVTAGNRLLAARQAAGLSRSDIASRTKIAERHLLAIEEDRFGDLAARAYAVGFARAYARALNLDEIEIAAVVRAQLDAENVDRPEVAPSFEPGDPARVPPVRLAWIAAGAAAVVIALLLVFWGGFLSPEGELPDLLSKETAAPATTAPAVAVPVQRAPVDQTVVLTATDDNVWLSITDASGATVSKTMSKGERWVVPGDAQSPQLRTGRPDALQLSVGGKPILPLSDRPRTVSGISLAPADLLARASSPQGGAGATPVPDQATPTAPASAPTASAPPAAMSRPASPMPSPRVTAPATARPAATRTAPSSVTPSPTVPSPTANARPTPRSSAPASTPQMPRATQSPSQNPTVRTTPTPAQSTPPAPSTAAPRPAAMPEPVSTDSE